MESYYFEASGPDSSGHDAAGRELFAVYHPPAEAARDAGVVLCHSFGSEAVRSHRAFFQLAGGLARDGFHALRFDAGGCGDSQDPADGLDLAGWRADVGAALGELREGSGASAHALAGLRLGAALAAQAAAASGGVDALVLWDPVVDGARYLEELRVQHREWLRGSFAVKAPSVPGVEEVLGFALPQRLAVELNELDLCSLDRAPARRALLLATGAESSDTALRARLESLGVAVDAVSLPAPPVWRKQSDELGDAVVPVQVLERIRAWLGEVFA